MRRPLFSTCEPLMESLIVGFFSWSSFWIGPVDAHGKAEDGVRCALTTGSLSTRFIAVDCVNVSLIYVA